MWLDAFLKKAKRTCIWQTPTWNISRVIIARMGKTCFWPDLALSIDRPKLWHRLTRRRFTKYPPSSCKLCQLKAQTFIFPQKNRSISGLGSPGFNHPTRVPLGLDTNLPLHIIIVRRVNKEHLLSIVHTSILIGISIVYLGYGCLLSSGQCTWWVVTISGF